MIHAVRLTGANFTEEVLKSSVPVLVDFWASWCLPSQESRLIMEELAVKYEGLVKVGMLQIDQNPGIRDSHRIEGCPTFILFVNGKENKRRKGVQSKGQLEQVLNGVLEQESGRAEGYG
jgi:thioredoxin 1